MARYPTFPMRMSNEDLMDMYKQIQSWVSILVNEHESRELEAQNTQSTNIFRVVTITSIGRPKKGDIAYSASSGKFKGYVSLGSETSWQDLN